MPTVGWIQETALDRYWERGGSGDNSAPKPKKHDCPYCTKQFKSIRDLSTHISVDHPIERPLMFLSGKRAFAEQTIRSPIDKSDIVFTHTTNIRVSKNGEGFREFSPDVVKNHLSDNENAHYSIILLNSDLSNERAVEASHIVKVKIAVQAELDNVDEQFIRMLAVDDAKMNDIREFAEECSSYASANEYASALATYVTGVLIKDQSQATGISQPFVKYKEKMQQAIETLKDFDRPIPRAICASIKFNINDFRTPPVPCGAELLDAANEFFHSLAQRQSAPNISIASNKSKELPACPIDRDSFELLNLFLKIHTGNINPSLVSDLSVLSGNRKLSDYDLSKMRALTAFAAIQTKDTNIEKSTLEDLLNDPIFGDWAESKIED